MGKKNKNMKLKGMNWTQLSLGGTMGAAQRIVRRLTTNVGAIVSSATGLTLIRVLSSQVSNAQEWANLSAVYVQARVIEVRVTLFPYRNPAAGTGFVGNGTDYMVVAGTDRSGALAAPTTVGGVFGLSQPKCFTSNGVIPHVITARAIDLEDQEFFAIGTPVAKYAIQVAAQMVGVTAAASHFWQLNEFICEFKGANA